MFVKSLESVPDNNKHIMAYSSVYYDLLSTSIERILSCLNRKIMHQFYLKMFWFDKWKWPPYLLSSLQQVYILTTSNTCYETDSLLLRTNKLIYSILILSLIHFARVGYRLKFGHLMSTRDWHHFLRSHNLQWVCQMDWSSP